MASDITLGYIFVPAEGTNRLTAQKLNRMGNGAVINPSFISAKPAVSGAASGDQFIMLKADGTYARVPATAFGGGGVAVNPGTWTAFAYQAGWSQNSSAAYRLQSTGTFNQVFFKGSIAKASGTTTNLAIVLPSGFIPSDIRRFRLAGQETNTSADEVSYSGVIDTSGNFSIYPIVRANDVWVTWGNLQTIWLDNVCFEI
jgi:hypothetical protein